MFWSHRFMFLWTIVWAAFISLVRTSQACRLHFLGSVWQLHERNEGTRPSFILASSFKHETCSDFRRYALITSYLSPEKKSSFQRIKKLVWNEYYFCVRIMQFRHPLLFFIFLKYWLIWNRCYRLVEQYINCKIDDYSFLEKAEEVFFTLTVIMCRLQARLLWDTS